MLCDCFADVYDDNYVQKIVDCCGQIVKFEEGCADLLGAASCDMQLLGVCGLSRDLHNMPQTNVVFFEISAPFLSIGSIYGPFYAVWSHSRFILESALHFRFIC